MTTAITRSDLFELVWSEPRTTLAKRFKLSDVAIGKHCRKGNIPMPPPGYWARKLAGKSSTRPPLPLRLPGQRDQVFPGEEDRYGYFNRTEDLEEILLPPVFPESAQLLVADAANRIGNIRACRDLSNPHPGLKRVLADENRRREAWAAQKYADYYKPYFDAPNLQRQLRLINSILWGFDRIDCKGEAYITEEWVQGTGHLHLLHCRICIGTTTVGFEFLEPTTPKSLNKAPPSGTTTLRIAAHPSGQSDWSDRADCKIEKQLTSIGVAMLELAENRLRNCATAPLRPMSGDYSGDKNCWMQLPGKWPTTRGNGSKPLPSITKPTLTIYGKWRGNINPLVKCAILSTQYANIQHATAPI